MQDIKGDYISPLSSFWVFTARYWNDPRLGECCFLSHYVICFVGRNNLLQRSNMKWFSASPRSAARRQFWQTESLPSLAAESRSSERGFSARPPCTCSGRDGNRWVGLMNEAETSRWWHTFIRNSVFSLRLQTAATDVCTPCSWLQMRHCYRLSSGADCKLTLILFLMLIWPLMSV